MNYAVRYGSFFGFWFLVMARKLRASAAGVPEHVIQRGNK
jgi:hypothetical protein